MTTSKRGKARNHMCSMCGASMHILWVTDCALGGTTRHRRCDNATCWHVEAVAKMDAKVYTTA